MIGVIFKPLDTSYASSEASLDPCLELSSTIRYTPSLSVTYPSTLSLTFLVTFLPIHLLTLTHTDSFTHSSIHILRNAFIHLLTQNPSPIHVESTATHPAIPTLVETAYQKSRWESEWVWERESKRERVSESESERKGEREWETRRAREGRESNWKREWLRERCDDREWMCVWEKERVIIFQVYLICILGRRHCVWVLCTHCASSKVGAQGGDRWKLKSQGMLWLVRTSKHLSRQLPMRARFRLSNLTMK